MMAAVIACVQTAPASAHKKKTKKKLSIPESRELECGGRGILTLNVDQPQTKQEREREKKQTKKHTRRHCVSLVCLCTLCLQQCKRRKKITSRGKVE